MGVFEYENVANELAKQKGCSRCVGCGSVDD